MIIECVHFSITVVWMVHRFNGVIKTVIHIYDHGTVRKINFQSIVKLSCRTQPSNKCKLAPSYVSISVRDYNQIVKSRLC